jgi:plastocyanin
MRHRSLAPLLLTTVAAVAIAACSGGSGTSAAPSAAAPSEPMSEAPASEAPASEAPASAAPSESASAAPSGSAEGTRVDVVGTEYEYSGLEASYSGPITIAFRNEGAEVHEIVVVKKNEGVTQSWEELLALPEDQSGELVTFAGVAFAEPGQTAADMVTASEPGEYMGICFIPAGTTELPSLDPNASGPPDLGTGAPHFTLGMLTEFTITE